MSNSPRRSLIASQFSLLPSMKMPMLAVVARAGMMIAVVGAITMIGANAMGDPGAAPAADAEVVRIALVAAGELPSPDRETCRLDARNPRLPRGLRTGDQVRIIRVDGRADGRADGVQGGLALFTVQLHRDGPAHRRDAIGLSAAGVARLGFADAETAANVGVKLDARAVGTSIVIDSARDEANRTAAIIAAARRSGDFVEIAQPTTAERFLWVMAPHGGNIEPGSDTIAEKIAADPALAGRAGLWVCKGYHPSGSAYDRWHITSTVISENSFPALAQLGGANRYRHVLALHGHSGADILIGGAGTAETKQKIKNALDALNTGIPVRILQRGDRLAGMASANIVNRYSADGVQIEFPRRARTDHADAIARAVASVYAR